MKAYKEYKDSGIEWIGEIPEHWNRIRIKHLVKIKVCDGPHETPEFVEEGVPFISADAIQNGQVNFQRKRGNITKETFAEYAKKSKVINGDILFCKSGSTTGKSAIVKTNESFAIWSPLAIIRANEHLVDNYYLYSFIQSNLFRLQVENSWTFGTQPNIGMGTLENLWIPIPTSKEQTQIANYLDYKTSLIDRLIEKNQRLIELLEEKRSAIINQAVTKGLNPNVKMKDSGIEWIGEIPEHWKITRLDYESDVIDPQPDHRAPQVDENGLPYIGIRDINYDGSINIETTRKVQELAVKKQEESFTVDDGDIVFCKVGTLGLPKHIIKPKIRFAISATLVLIKVSKFNDSRFIKYLLESNYINNQVENNSTGSTRKALGIQIIRKFKFLIMELKEQTQIANYLDYKTAQIDKLVVEKRKTNEYLKEYTTTLISNVVTGKVDVRDIKIPENSN
ncbi:MAG: restriction endonuclease subunit S [Deltaproteobacteria bacterium]